MIKNLDDVQNHLIILMKRVYKDNELNAQVNRELLKLIKKLIENQNNLLSERRHNE